jgi:hypothetical protein
MSVPKHAIWRGWGVLVVVVGYLGLLAGQLIGTAIDGPAGYDQNGQWVVGLGLLAAAGVLWPIARRQNSGERVVIDKETGQEVVVRPGHALFFIPMQYWSPIWAAIGVLLIVGGLLRR